MALRVLLADESVTIKKVFQLALQDFAAEITPVTVGLDVLQVASKIKPDIVFTDVLLQKKNGYDVCREIKAHPELGHTPVVLIWSGFMEFDEARFQASGADAHLEKPFDTQRLRQVVQKLVAKTQSQGLSQFLSFPKLPDFEEPPQAGGHAAPQPVAAPAPTIAKVPTATPLATPTRTNPVTPIPAPPALDLSAADGSVERETPFFPPPPRSQPQQMPSLSRFPTPPPAAVNPPSTGATGSWSMDAFEHLETPAIPPLHDERSQIVEAVPGAIQEQLASTRDEAEEFVAVPLPSEPRPPAATRKPRVVEEVDADPEDAQWVQKTLSNYKLDPAKASAPTPTVKYDVPEEAIDPDSFVSNTWTGRSRVDGQKVDQKPAAQKVTQKPAATQPVRAATPPLPSPDEDEVFELDLQDEPAAPQAEAIPQFTEKQLEAIIRAQAKDVIEKVVWQVVPEIATRIIERELARLLNERKNP